MAKKNNSLLDEIGESDWKFSAWLVFYTFVFVFIFLPVVLPNTIASIFLSVIQTLATWFMFFCAIVSIIKFINATGQTENLYFDFEQEERRYPIKEEIKDVASEPNWLVDDFPVIEIENTQEIETKVEDRWTLDFINSLDWKVFEDLCSEYYNAIGIKNRQTGLGADEGIDLYLYHNNSTKPTAIIQCKKWSNPIGVTLLRELLGVMHHKKLNKAYFYTTSKFNRSAIKFADESNIKLVDGVSLITKLKNLDKDKQESIYASITVGDYTTPTCVRCGAKMVLRKNKKTKEEFWACNKYKCRSTLSIKTKPKSQTSNSLLY